MSRGRLDEETLTADIIALTSQYGGYLGAWLLVGDGTLMLAVLAAVALASMILGLMLFRSTLDADL